MDIQLNFVNQSSDTNNSNIVIFQKNAARSGAPEMPTAWRVIQNCGPGDNHPFVYPTGFEVSGRDQWGVLSSLLAAKPGQAFAIGTTDDGIAATGPATSALEIQVTNGLRQGAADAVVFKDGSPFAEVSGLAPGQTAAFELKPSIWIGPVSEIQQGELMNAAIVETVNTQISLAGLVSADIVMTGGGTGPMAKPYIFALKNVVLA